MIVRNPLLWKDFSPLISILFFFPLCAGNMSAETPITLQMDMQDLQIQTFTVEKLLEPLIIQVWALWMLQCATAMFEHYLKQWE